MSVKLLLDSQGETGKGGEGCDPDFEVFVLKLFDQACDDWC